MMICSCNVLSDHEVRTAFSTSTADGDSGNSRGSMLKRPGAP
jgi:hypothetical protein